MLPVFLGAGVAAAQAAEGTPPPSVWTQFQGGPAHTGSVSSITPAQPPYTRSWTFEEPDTDLGFAAPVIVGDVAVALGSEAVYGVDLSSGQQAWRVQQIIGFEDPSLLGRLEDVDGLVFRIQHPNHFDAGMQILPDFVGDFGGSFRW